MKSIILAAGKGERLRPFTDDIPKCMVKFNDKPLIQHILEAMLSCDMKDISIVGGYKADVLEKYLNQTFYNKGIKFYQNQRYDTTNMVYTLFSAAEEMIDDLVISYSDIIYNKNVLKQLMECTADIGVVVDKEWLKLWQKRMDNPLDDAETMKINEKGNIIELGKKAQNYSEIQGQYIGLIKFSKKIIQEIKQFYLKLDRTKTYDGKNLENMYMTSFIQLLINAGYEVKAVDISGGWVEIDTVEDLNNLKDYTI